jgi:DNA-binding HxlR family transcriptional regulator
MREIARRNHMQVSPYLTGCVLQLVLDGQVNQTEMEGVYPKTYVYSLTHKGQELADLLERLGIGE